MKLHTAGAVVALKTEKYVQAGGGSRPVRELEVAVVDPKTNEGGQPRLHHLAAAKQRLRIGVTRRTS